jgi:hypothetical protein
MLDCSLQVHMSPHDDISEVARYNGPRLFLCEVIAREGNYGKQEGKFFFEILLIISRYLVVMLF